jgi:hypothetical protein
MAPEGYKLLIADFAQVEYRALCALAGQRDMLDALRTGRDLYIEFATELYGQPITKADKPERGVGKKGVLSSGYGCGWETFQTRCHEEKLFISSDEARRAVALFRKWHPEIVAFWKLCDHLIAALFQGIPAPKMIGPIRAEGKALILPNGLRMPYRLRKEGRDYFRVEREGKRSKIWAGMMAENLASSISRVMLSDVTLEFPGEGLFPVLMAHDELVYCAPAEQAEALLIKILEAMSRTPSWWPDGPPMSAEGRVADRYGKGADDVTFGWKGGKIERLPLNMQMVRPCSKA